MIVMFAKLAFSFLSCKPFHVFNTFSLFSFIPFFIFYISREEGNKEIRRCAYAPRPFSVCALLPNATSISAARSNAFFICKLLYHSFLK